MLGPPPSPSICPVSGKERGRLPPRPETEAAGSRKPAHFPCKLLSQLLTAIIPDMCGNWRPLQGSFHPCCKELSSLSRALLWAANHNTAHVVSTSKMVWWFKTQVRRNEGVVMDVSQEGSPQLGAGTDSGHKVLYRGGLRLGQDKGLNDTCGSRDPDC